MTATIYLNRYKKEEADVYEREHDPTIQSMNLVPFCPDVATSPMNELPNLQELILFYYFTLY